MNSSLQDEVNLLHSELCGALADPKRIMILYALSDGSMNVSALKNLARKGSGDSNS
jgi:DNA-binding transcriptional ArsR family regulator